MVFPPVVMRPESWGSLGLSLLLGTGIGACKGLADAQSPRPPAAEQPDKIAVQVAIAQTSQDQGMTYPGTTQPFQEVVLRAQTEGRITQLGGDVGDRLGRGQLVARIDDRVLAAELQAQAAEVAARQGDGVRLQGEIQQAAIAVARAQAEYEQAWADAQRFQQLAKDGALSLQQAQASQTQAKVARQAVQTAQQQVQIKQKELRIAQERTRAQRAVLAQNQARLSYATLRSPLAGVILAKSTEVGNLVRSGDEVMRLGNFAKVKITVPVSELQIAQIRPGQGVAVRFDALGQEPFSGEVSRISPLANGNNRQIPVEVLVDNPDGAIGAGWLARVDFGGGGGDRIRIPEQALQEDRRVFILQKQGETYRVQGRSVQLGQRQQKTVEILSGLRPGERYVLRSSQPLKEGDTVVLSALSPQEAR